MSWYQHFPIIETQLKKHFPLPSEKERTVWCDEIYDSWSTSLSLEVIERSDRPSAKDIESLEKVEKLLRDAALELKELGWHGCKQLEPAATVLANKFRDQNWPFQSRILESKEIFSEHLKDLHKSVQGAKNCISPEAESVNTTFGEGPEFGRRKGKKTKTAAKFTADTCLNAFEALLNERATVRTADGVAYGPFLDFVTDIFEALDIDASPETWARAAVKHARAQP